MSELAEMDLSGINAAQERQILDRLLRDDFDAWAEQASRVGHCAHPIRLTGEQNTVDTATGSVLSTFASASLPDEVLYVRCNNRRASWCPSCSRTYQGDMWHLLKAGAAGGDKGVPESVASHPMVFATLTAPSFGPVHAAKKPGSKTRRCRPRSRGEFCRHGKSSSCMDIHAEHDPIAGQPFCGDCYDYDAHVVWQWWAPELWRRFTVALPRLIAKCLGVTQKQARRLARVSFAKVGEYQARGVIHFHAIIRLDGPPADAEHYPAPLVDVDSSCLADLVREAVVSVQYEAPPVSRAAPGYLLRFGVQVDARPVHLSAGRDDLSGAIHPETVAAYIAKYSTKSATDLDPGTRTANPHLARVRSTVLQLSDVADNTYPPGLPEPPNPYLLLRKWAHMLAFRGHFASKSRRYSTTMGRLRSARRRFEHAKAFSPDGVVDVEALDKEVADDETTLVVNDWHFVGTGWITPGDAVLVAEASAVTREYTGVGRVQSRNTTTK
ncbi:MAG TPA: replication initiator [Dermatophilaceae bacterium]